jgi:hypothetical protein
MIESTLTAAERVIGLLQSGGPWAVAVIEGVVAYFVIRKLWKENAALHKKLERH